MSKIWLILLLALLAACGGAADEMFIPETAPAPGAAVADGASRDEIVLRLQREADAYQPWGGANDWVLTAGEGVFADAVETPQMEAFNLAPQDAFQSNMEPPAYGIFEDEAFPHIGAEQRIQRIIQNANLSLETYEFDDTVTAIRTTAARTGGFIEHSEMQAHRTRRIFTATLRIPVDNFDHVLWHLESLAFVMSSSQWANNVTAEFYNIHHRLEVRRIEEERVLNLIEEAANLANLLALEQRLARVRTEIELYQSRLDYLDQRASYSTIWVTLTERIAEEPEEEEEEPYIAATLTDRIGGAFTASFDGTLSVLQELVIFLAGIVVPITAIIFLILVGLKGAKIVQHKRKA